MIDTRHLDTLRKILGEKGVLAGSHDMGAYENGARHDRGRAAFVARPGSTREVSAVVSYCVRNGLPLIPQSGNTGLVSGSTPDMSGAQGILSLDRLAGNFTLDRINRTVQAGAGMRLSDLNARLEAHGLFFPIDLGADPRLGGMIATNTGGARFLRYGDVRRNTLGLTVVLADEKGTILELAGPLRKNNTGLDWKQIFLGTSGAFGVITECVLNVELLPRQTATVLLTPSSPDNIPLLIVAMEEAFGSDLSAFEGISGNALRAALSHVPSLRNPFQGGLVPDYVILVEISRSNVSRSGEQPLDAALEEALAAVWESDDNLLSDAIFGPAHEIWALRHALSEGVSRAGRLVAFDLSFRRGDVMRFLGFMQKEMPSRFPGVTICDFGHIGDGGVHFNVIVDSSVDAAFEAALREWVLTTCVEKFSGSFSSEHGIGRKNQAIYDEFTPAKIRGMSKLLKEGISPGHVGSITL